jgi:hypothetical protein
MKKLFALLSFVVLAAAMSFAGTINYSNQTNETIQFLRDGNPPGIGSNVIPNGFYSETMPYGVYILSATNGRETTGGTVCTLNEDNNRCDYRAYRQQTFNTNPNLNLVLVSQTQYDGFSVNAPITLTTTGPTQSINTAGQAFTSTLYSAAMPNTDFYMATVSVYPFTVVDEDLDKGTNAFVQSLHGKVLKQDRITVSGQPAIMSAISSKDETGREVRFALTITYKGNRAYMFAFGSYMDVTTTDEASFKAFFNSISIN